MYFMQLCLAYAAAFGYNQFPQYGGKILTGHLLCALGADVSNELHRQKKERDLERKIIAQINSQK